MTMESDSDSSTLIKAQDHETDLAANTIIEDLTKGTRGSSGSEDVPTASGKWDETPLVIKPRPYQLEMFEESLKRNIIVAMDTGSGKTQVAILLMLHELEHIPQHKYIWFLASTVELCTQQHEKITAQISTVQTKLLRGEDSIELWKGKHWDLILKDTKIFVSHYAILFDALSHGYVQMESLALMVFDEAHNCVKKYPGARIMHDYYHPRKHDRSKVPKILGLTASPVMRSDPKSVCKIEETLDAICRTPSKHRAELQLQVKLPVLSHVQYQCPALEDLSSGYTKTVQSLGHIVAGLKLSEDPYYINLLRDNTARGSRRLEKVRMNEKTWCRDQMKTFYATTLTVCRELGTWAADYYVSEVVSKVLMMASKSDGFGDWDVSGAEKKYISKALSRVELSDTAYVVPISVSLVSDKVTKLVKVLLGEVGAFSGIVFVQERAVVNVLSHLLSVHPQTRDRFTVGPFVGTSTNAFRNRNICELMGMNSQRDSLDQFKSGELNLVVATSVLEEGIDVPVCNLVICFQKPANLKSFVQRRGRARHRDSKLVLLLDSEDDKLSEWQQLESDMKAIYKDEMRTLQELLVLEDSEEHDDRKLEVKSNGARLDLDHAVAHLYHFCALVTKSQYVDSRPEFICSTDATNSIRARVILPLAVNEAVRYAESKFSWKSEKNAIKDAAFEAYAALYHAGLLNDNLLPLMDHDTDPEELTSTRAETRSSLASINGLVNPWVEVAKAWKDTSLRNREPYRSLIKIGSLEIEAYCSIELPQILSPFKMFWDAKTEVLITTETLSSSGRPADMSKAMEDTWTMLSATGRFNFAKKPLAVQFSTPNYNLSSRECQPFVLGISDTVKGSTLIRNTLANSLIYIFQEYLPQQPAKQDVQDPYPDYEIADPKIPHVAATKISRRLDFLHPSVEALTTKPFSSVFPASHCVIDQSMPFEILQFGLLIPTIIHRFEVLLLAQMLSNTILQRVKISDQGLVATAISASSAREGTDYQRLEFLGDTVLKMCTSVQITAEFLLWPEGYLSRKKDRLVGNARLCSAARDTGLDKFIIKEPFTGRKWRPPYVDDLLGAQEPPQREMSTKVLADVVEALIGVSVLDGGIPKALLCLQIFLPEIKWLPLQERRLTLYNNAPNMELPTTLQSLERLIGYTFNKKSLLVEAMTHASYTTGTQSLERCEFLGDSILDYIIVTAMWDPERELSHFQMHLLKTTMVNADFLAFICMEFSTSIETTDLTLSSSPPSSFGNSNFIPITKTTRLPLWRFMQHASPVIARAQGLTSRRHTLFRDEINAAIQSGKSYPWLLLSLLRAPKFFSDLVESLLGALWIDSGSFEICTEFVEKIGILPYLRRIIAEGVHVWHPREELGVQADQEKVKYRLSDLKLEGSSKQSVKCEVFVGERKVAEAEDRDGTGAANDKLVVAMMAAEKALLVLKKEKLLATDAKARKRKSPGWLRDEDVDMDDDVEMSGTVK